MALNPNFRTEETYGVVVVAADGVGSALVASADTDDGDGAAVEADEDVQVLEEDAEEAQDDADTSRVGLFKKVSRERLFASCNEDWY